MNQAIGDLGTGSAASALAKADGRDPAEMRKRSVVIAGHRTSVSLENAFWNALKAIAAARDMTVNQMVTHIDNQRSGNLSSAIRLFVLDSYRRGDGEQIG